TTRESEEVDERRDQVDERWQRLQEVQDRSYDDGDRVVAGRPDSDRDTDEQGYQAGQEHQGEAVHRVRPLAHGLDHEHPDERADRELPALGEERQQCQDDGNQQRWWSAQDEVQRVVETLQDRLDEGEDDRERVGQPVDEGLDPVAERQREEWFVHRVPPALVVVCAPSGSSAVISVSPFAGEGADDGESSGAIASSRLTRGITPESRPWSSTTARGTGDSADGANRSTSG